MALPPALFPILARLLLPAAPGQEARVPFAFGELVYMCEDLAPSNYLDHDTLTGFSVELLDAMWKTMGVPKQPVRVVPWARGYNTILHQPGQVLFSMSRTPERDTLFKWVGPIFSVHNVFLGRSGDKLRISGLDDAKKVRIGVVKGDVVEAELLERGFDRARLESVSDLRQNFEKLRSNRIDLIAHSERSLHESIDLMHLARSAYSTKFVLSESRNFYAFSRSTPDSIVERFQKTLDGLSPLRNSLLSRYRLAP
jgi:polar amino acid transport system substrate-binding protein